MKDVKTGKLSPSLGKAMLTEALRAELQRLLVSESNLSKVPEPDLEARIAALEEENNSLRKAARRGDRTLIEGMVKAAAPLVGLSDPASVLEEIGRDPTALKRRINEVELDVPDGDATRQAAKPLMTQEGIDDLDAFVAPPMLIFHPQSGRSRRSSGTSPPPRRSRQDRR